MESFLFVLCGVLAFAVILLTVKVHIVRKSADEICSSLADRLSDDTNTLIDISSRDPHMRKLASNINTQLRLLREERHRFCKGDAELKDAVANISHDLRTPLTAICGYLDLLENEEKSEKVTQYLDMIGNRTQVLKQLTQELFRYSVIVSVNDDERENIDIKALLEDSLVSNYAVMQQRKIVPVISLPENKVERYLNRSAVSRIFGNIIANAVKYSDGDFNVEMNERGSIIFSNTAEKLDTVSVGRLFDRFYTVETGRNSTGLGLSIAKLLTERMGGTLTADYCESKLRIILSFESETELT